MARIAAILDDGGGEIDGQLATFASEQRRAGLRVRGLVMTYRDSGEGCRRAMVLVDVDTGEEYPVSQQLGSGSTSCQIDPQGFAHASQVLRNALEQAPDLVICNRFGGLEAENGGFVAELLALLVAGVPVLTVVAERHLDAWRRFSGDAPLLPPDRSAWSAWLTSVLTRRHPITTA